MKNSVISINQNFLKLQASYLFSEISKRVSAFQEQNPDREIIKLGIGDVVMPLPASCVQAFHTAVDEMASLESFRGYGPYEGYQFLREKIVEHDFTARGAKIAADEIFVSDGAKCDTSNFQELFSAQTRIAVQDPVYPVYVDSNVIAGRTGEFIDGRYPGLVYLESTPENNYLPVLPSEPVDLICLCFPNNPTGSTISKERLKSWVDYARENDALILYDAAYVAFIRDDSVVQSIYEIEGAEEVAVEFRSFSKNAGFTGVRCAYTVVPKVCRAFDSKGDKQSLHSMWTRRQSTKFNGVSYPVQKAAEAVYSEQGQLECSELADYYLRNAKLLREAVQSFGLSCAGGDHAPYIWINAERDSWAFFDQLLNQAGVVCTPGSGFGRCGEGHIRLSAFNTKENVEKAIEQLRDVF